MLHHLAGSIPAGESLSLQNSSGCVGGNWGAAGMEVMENPMRGKEHTCTEKKGADYVRIWGE